MPKCATKVGLTRLIKEQAQKSFRPLRKKFRNCLDFLSNFLGIFWKEFFGGIFLGGILCLNCSNQLSYLNIEGIDLLVKILSEGRRKEEI